MQPLLLHIIYSRLPTKGSPRKSQINEAKSALVRESVEGRIHLPPAGFTRLSGKPTVLR
jgi:hypothetical protein